MPASAANLFTRDDTLLGVCEGIGEEFGLHPNYLRVLLGAALLWNVLAVIGLYLAAGVVLMVGRWLFPVRRPAVVQSPAAAGGGVAQDLAAPAFARAA